MVNKDKKGLVDIKNLKHQIRIENKKQHKYKKIKNTKNNMYELIMSKEKEKYKKYEKLIEEKLRELIKIKDIKNLLLQVSDYEINQINIIIKNNNYKNDIIVILIYIKLIIDNRYILEYLINKYTRIIKELNNFIDSDKIHFKYITWNNSEHLLSKIDQHDMYKNTTYDRKHVLKYLLSEYNVQLNIKNKEDFDKLYKELYKFFIKSSRIIPYDPMIIPKKKMYRDIKLFYIDVKQNLMHKYLTFFNNYLKYLNKGFTKLHLLAIFDHNIQINSNLKQYCNSIKKYINQNKILSLVKGKGKTLPRKRIYSISQYMDSYTNNRLFTQYNRNLTFDPLHIKNINFTVDEIFKLSKLSDNTNQNALHYLLKNNNCSGIPLFELLDFNKNQKDNNNKTPFDYMSETKYKRQVKHYKNRC